MMVEEGVFRRRVDKGRHDRPSSENPRPKIRFVGLCKILRIESIDIEGGGTCESLLASLICGEFLSHLDKIGTGRNNWNLSNCNSEEPVKWHWLLVLVSQVGVCFDVKSPQILSCLTRPHPPHETRLDLVRQTGEQRKMAPGSHCIAVNRRAGHASSLLV